ncbi:MAG TPA: M48 family metalloprotease [Candidatus Babeliales bacterium]|nr:M48 family metalloprotease [Candidatus Babeliales bacterium]
MLKNYKKIVTIIALLGLVALGVVVLQKNTVSNAPKNNPVDYYHQMIIDQEKNTWNALASIGLTKSKVDALYLQNSKDYKESDIAQPAKLPKAILELIHKTMVDCKINPQSVTIAITDEDSHAMATDSILYINTKLFNALSHEAQQFVLAHEFAHMHFKDNSTTYTINDAMEKNNIAHKNTVNFPRNIYGRFKEIRADIHAALTAPEYAHAYITFMNETIRASGENRGISHPKNSERLALAQEIYAALKTA